MSEIPSEPIGSVRDHLSDVVDRADREDRPTVITRRGKEVAAVVSMATLRRFQQWEEQEINALIDERMASSTGQGATLEEVLAETMARPE